LNYTRAGSELSVTGGGLPRADGRKSYAARTPMS